MRDREKEEGGTKGDWKEGRGEGADREGWEERERRRRSEEIT